MFKTLKIRTKLTLVIVVIVLISVFATNYYGYSVARDNIRKEVLGSLKFHSQLEQAHLMDFVEQAQKRVVDFSSDGLIREEVEKIQKGMPGAQAGLSRHLSVNKQPLDKYIYGINIFSSDSKVIASTSGTEIGKVELEDEYVNSSLNAKYGESYITDVGVFERHFDQATPSFVVSTPVYSVDKTKRLGVIALYLKAQELNEILGHIESKGAQEGAKDTYAIDTYITNSSGFLVTPSMLTKGDVLQKKIDTLPVGECKEGREVNGVYKNGEAISVVASSRCLKNGWTLILEVEESKAFSSINSVRGKILLASAFISLAALLVVYFMVRQSTEPLKKLLSFTKRVGEGDLSSKLAIVSRDEIGQLGESLNDMVRKIRASREGLEGEVEKRTGELEQMRKKVEDANKRLEKEVKEAKGEMEALKELQKTSEMFKVSAESMIDGFTIMSAIRKNGEVTDLRYEYINEAGCKLNRTTPSRILGKTLLEFLPKHKASGLFDKYVQVIQTGTPYMNDAVQYEDYYEKEKLNRWFEVRAIKLGDGLAVTWRDISEKRKKDAQIEEQVKQLEEFKELTVGRELKMIELKNEINKLKKEVEAA